VATGREIICITHSHGNITRIALGTRDRVVEVFKIDAKGELNVVFCVQLDTTVPIAITFVDNTARDVLVFGLYDGKM
jgi:L-cysteine desulfidase